MSKILKLGVLGLTLLMASCDRQYNLSGSEWKTVKFSIDSTNYLSELDKSVYLSFDTSKKLHVKFADTLAFAYVEGAPIDTSVYRVKNDTLFFTQGTYKDTSIILKLTNDSLIEQRLAGVRTYSVSVEK